MRGHNEIGRLWLQCNNQHAEPALLQDPFDYCGKRRIDRSRCTAAILDRYARDKLWSGEDNSRGYLLSAMIWIKGSVALIELDRPFPPYVRFSNRPFGVKHFQTMRRTPLDSKSEFTIAQRDILRNDGLGGAARSCLKRPAGRYAVLFQA